jgi:hypothetical protein
VVSPLLLPHTMSLEFKFLVAYIIGLGNSSPPPRVCGPLPRVTPHGMESSETMFASSVINNGPPKQR